MPPKRSFTSNARVISDYLSNNEDITKLPVPNNPNNLNISTQLENGIMDYVTKFSKLLQPHYPKPYVKPIKKPITKPITQPVIGNNEGSEDEYKSVVSEGSEGSDDDYESVDSKGQQGGYGKDDFNEDLSGDFRIHMEKLIIHKVDEQKITPTTISINADELINMINNINNKIKEKDKAINIINGNDESDTSYEINKQNINIPTTIMQSNHENKVIVSQFIELKHNVATIDINCNFLKKTLQYSLPPSNSINRSILEETINERNNLITQLQALYIMFPVVECKSKSFTFPLYVFKNATVINNYDYIPYCKHIEDILTKYQLNNLPIKIGPFISESTAEPTKQDGGRRRAAPKTKTTSQQKAAPKTKTTSQQKAAPKTKTTSQQKAAPKPKAK